MKEMKNKVVRKHVDWYQAYLDIGDPELDKDFYMLLQKHPKMSMNRIAYNVLKKHYSTTSMVRYRWTGSFYE